jgi:4-hydroxy-tetrahydrodipicolinate synthase
MLEGIIPPLVTPFDERGEMEEQAHRAEVRYLTGQAGVHGLAVGGSTGEGHTLTREELRQLTAWTVEEAQGRVPVVAGIIANSTREAIERGRAVADLGVAALQVTPVHYLFAPDEESSVRHFAEIAEITGIPIIIYNVIPWSYQPPQRLARILAEVPGVIGVKQSACDLKTLADLLLLAPASARIFTAVDALLYPSFVLGAHGSIGAIVTAAPTWCLALWNAVRCGEHRAAMNWHKRLLRLWNALDGPNLPANVKTAMELQGRCAGRPRGPMPPTSAEQRDRIALALRAED